MKKNRTVITYKKTQYIKNIKNRTLRKKRTSRKKRTLRKKRTFRKHIKIHYKQRNKESHSMYKMKGGVGGEIPTRLRTGFNNIMARFGIQRQESRVVGIQRPESSAVGIHPPESSVTSDDSRVYISRGIPVVNHAIALNTFEKSMIDKYMREVLTILAEKNIHQNHPLYAQIEQEMRNQFHEAIKFWRATNNNNIRFIRLMDELKNNVSRYVAVPENRELPFRPGELGPRNVVRGIPIEGSIAQGVLVNVDDVLSS
jgi:hypothetical protein